MKFAEHLSAHITPEWRKQYIEYEAMKAMIYTAREQAPPLEDNDQAIVERHYAKVHEQFFQMCEQQLKKINNFYAEKLAEAMRKLAGLKSELESRRIAGSETQTAPAVKPKLGDTGHGKTVGKKGTSGASTAAAATAAAAAAAASLPPTPLHGKKLHELKLAFSEFYLGLILLQNYQQLNFTGFRKITKKYDKLLGTTLGSQWHQANVETAHFYTNKEADKLILETENVVITQLEGGDRGKAMKRLRVPPLAEKQNPWTTFRVGLYLGMFLVLAVAITISSFYVNISVEWQSVVRMYRGPFLIILFCFLIGANTYGWRAAGVNHVLIFELDPRNHLTYSQFLEVGSFFAVLWAVSLMGFLFSNKVSVPPFVHPLWMVGVLFIYLMNPLPILHHKARRWLLKVLFRIVTTPFHVVRFADFWLADQLNSLSLAIQDIEFVICYYSSSIDWWSGSKSSRCESVQYGIKPIVAVLPAFWRFTQCWRRYYDSKHAYPHIANAFKYSTTFFVVMFSALNTFFDEVHKQRAASLLTTTMAMPVNESSNDTTAITFAAAVPTVFTTGMVRSEPDPWTVASIAEHNVFYHLWIVSAIVSSVYTYTWDVKLDWGLFAKNAGDNKLLREQTVYQYKAYYYFAMVEDLVLRFAWTLTVSVSQGSVLDSEILRTILGVLEVFRRFIWNYFRLENEHLNNIGEYRAVRDISVTPINRSDQVLLERMMDDEDGVTNRSAGKPGKKSKSHSRGTLDELDEVTPEPSWNKFKGGITNWLRKTGRTLGHQNTETSLTSAMVGMEDMPI